MKKAITFEGIVIEWIDELKATHPKGRLTTPTVFDIRRLKRRLTSITKGTRRVGNATYGTYRFGRGLEPKAAWKVIEAIEEQLSEGGKVSETTIRAVKLKGKKPHRIRKDDLSAVLKSVIDYTERPQEYEEYLSQTCRVNLKLRQALDEGGLKFELTVDRTDDNACCGKMLLSLPLARRKGKNYVIIRGNEYRVKDTQALFDLGKESHRYYGQQGQLLRTIKLLYRGIRGITPEVIGRIISQGKREYAKMNARIKAEEEAKVKNSNEFLHNASARWSA